MYYIISFLFIFNVQASELQTLKLRDGSVINYNSKKLEVVDALKSLGQNFFLVEDKITKTRAVLLTYFSIRNFQGKETAEKWCEGELEGNFCRIKNEHGNVVSVMSPSLNNGVATIHSISYQGNKNQTIEAIITNVKWINK